MKHFIALISFVIIVFPANTIAQEIQEVQHIEGDSVNTEEIAPILLQVPPPTLDTFKPDPTKAIIYSAIFPGLGQIYNRKYWKLPIVYGGFLGCMYAITWNGNQYNGYKNAYNDFADNNPNTRSWEAYLIYNMRELDADPALWPDANRTWFKSALKNKKDFYRRNRDLSYIITIGAYAICMIDAYVDAQLFDFEISQDLSFRFEPVIIPQATTNSRTFGLQCSLTF